MNWTGGKLHRHSKNAKSGAAHRQSEYFAKARTKLQNGSERHTPFVPSFLQDEAAHHDTNSPRPRQSRLEHFDQTAPVAKRLSALSQTSSHRRRVTEPSRAGLSLESERLSSIRQKHSQQRTREAELLEHRGSKIARQTQSSRPLPRKRLHSRDGNESIEAKKRRILLQGDWTGLQTTKPLHVDFKSNESRELIGKRRKLNEHDHLRRAGMGERKKVPSVGDRGRRIGPRPDGLSDTNDDGRSIKIRIGDDAFLSQTSTRPSQLPQNKSSARPLIDEADTDPYEDDSTGQANDANRNGSSSSFLPLELSDSHSAPNLGSFQGFSDTPCPTERRHHHENPLRTRKSAGGISEAGREWEKPDPSQFRLIFPSTPPQESGWGDQDAQSQEARASSQGNTTLADLHGKKDTFDNQAREESDEERWRSFTHINKRHNAPSGMVEEDLAAVAHVDDDRNILEEDLVTAQPIDESRNVLEGESDQHHTLSPAPPVTRIFNASREENSRDRDHSSAHESPTFKNHSPPSSLLKLNELANKPPQPPHKPTAEDEEEAAWKAFIFGSTSPENSYSPDYRHSRTKPQQQGSESSKPSHSIAANASSSTEGNTLETDSSFIERASAHSNVATCGAPSHATTSPQRTVDPSAIESLVPPRSKKHNNETSASLAVGVSDKSSSASSPDPLARREVNYQLRPRVIWTKPRPFGRERAFDEGEDEMERRDERTVRIGGRTGTKPDGRRRSRVVEGIEEL
ncbi:MAG: hypothetical protein M1831_007504 [Alyxoria varia]|nr:MAG: hypothetical protein M1831_007504 [Alyxoria varia]